MADEPGDKPPAENPSKKFLDLAAKGKHEWNKWRHANEDEPVNFADVDFSKAPNDQINFSGFEFGDDADFSRCKWRDIPGLEAPADFKPGRASFAGAVFGSGANFTGAVFPNWADFTSTTFGLRADFTFVVFDWWANFTSAYFGDLVLFTGATFGWKANFTGAAFDNVADFTGAAFNSGANFEGAVFKGYVSFKGTSGAQWTESFHNLGLGQDDRNVLSQRHEVTRKSVGVDSASGPDRFLSISFANARFDREAIFSSRDFEADANFTNARFYYPPDFDAVNNASRIDFTGAHIGFSRRDAPRWKKHWTTNTQIPVRLRAFRKIVEETKNHDLERDLYIEERKAERGVVWRRLLEVLERDRKNSRRNSKI
ncbi:MAG: pentapeptide repeat-containing protein [Methylocella sp.]|jgi:uncharacterized protein YjbI with pentapeptide repeats